MMADATIAPITPLTIRSHTGGFGEEGDGEGDEEGGGMTLYPTKLLTYTSWVL